MAKPNFSDEVWQGMGDAIADIRQKVVEEPWFGRAVTERGDAPEWPKAEEPGVVPQGLSGEVLGPEQDVQPAPSSEHLLERGQVINNEPAQWPEARTIEPTQSLEDRSLDVDLDR